MAANYTNLQKNLNLDWIHVSGEMGSAFNALNFRGNGVVVGIMSDGIDLTHESFKKSGADGTISSRATRPETEQSDNGFVFFTSDMREGTSMASIVGGSKTYGSVVGVAPECTILDFASRAAFRGTTPPSSTGPEGFLPKMLSSLAYLNGNVPQGGGPPSGPGGNGDPVAIDVLIISGLFQNLDSATLSPAGKIQLQQIIESLKTLIVQKNVVVVIAMQNHGTRLGVDFVSPTPYYGEEVFSGHTDMHRALDLHEMTLSVGSHKSPSQKINIQIAENLDKSKFSDFGAERFLYGGLLGPGESISSAKNGGGYLTTSGCHNAAAFVAGIAALIIGFCKRNGLTYTASTVYRLIKSCCYPILTAEVDDRDGFEANEAADPVFVGVYNMENTTYSSNEDYTNSFAEQDVYAKTWNFYSGFGCINIKMLYRVLLDYKAIGSLHSHVLTGVESALDDDRDVRDEVSVGEMLDSPMGDGHELGGPGTVGPLGFFVGYPDYGPPPFEATPDINAAFEAAPEAGGQPFNNS